MLPNTLNHHLKASKSHGSGSNQALKCWELADVPWGVTQRWCGLSPGSLRRAGSEGAAGRLWECCGQRRSSASCSQTGAPFGG